MHTNMNDKQIDELIDKTLLEDQSLPEGLSWRLEQQINAWATAEKNKMRSQLRKRALYWLSGVAAVALLCIGFFQPDMPFRSSHRRTDTYTDPKEAATAAQKALLFMSQNLNKGIDQATDAQQEISKVNSILDKHIKD